MFKIVSKKVLLFGLLLSILLAVLVTVSVAQEPGQGLKMVMIDADSPAQVAELVGMGVDVAAVQEGPAVNGPRGVPVQTFRVAAVVAEKDEKLLSQANFSWSEVPGRGPTHKIGSPYDVYHSYDEPLTGVRAELRKIKADYPHLAQLKTIGETLHDRPILALRLTNEKIKGDKPQVLFHATTHAREWVSTQVALRLIDYLTTNYGSDARVTDLLDTTEVWIIPVVNPDGYQYTFTNERLWRKNLRDNDGDGEITLADGVDINRNFDGHWGQDNEGSSADWPNATYRGEAPESEPETRALVTFIENNDFEFIVSYHTFGNLILYPWGWQVSTPSHDDPIFVAQSGTDANPAIHDSLLNSGYDPGVGADLYITNGEFTDWSYGDLGIPSYTIELTFGSDLDGSNFYGFEFPDDEGMVQTVFEDNLEFALSLAESAHDPAHPVSPVGISTEDVYHTPVTDSYGSDQIIEVLARKGLALNLSYSINGGPSQSANFSEKLGDFYNEESGTYYSKYEVVISGQSAGDNVAYQVSGGANNIAGNYTVTSATGHPILLVAAEDYSGAFPTYGDPTQPNYLQYYTDALDAGGYAYDVWDVDTQGIPNYVEVLSHYEVAIWYTGDDFAPVIPNGFRTHQDEYLAFRDFINYEGGRLFATGQDLAWISAVLQFVFTDPGTGQTVVLSDDFFQYYLGANLDIDTGGIDSVTHLPSDVRGESGDPIFDGLTFSLHNGNGGDGADNQCCSSTFLSTSSFLPHFEDVIAARYDRVGGPFDPHSGDYYVYSQLADLAHKRLGGTFNIPAGAPTLKFWTSYDIETNWDFAFVEISQAGSGVWTTLPDLNGGTTTNTGLSCLSGWVDQIHPFLGNYMDAACSPTGATGSWNAFTGNSAGWQQVEMDLSAYAGQTVELYISYATDWATQGLGVFVDDIELAGAPLEDFETGLGQWEISTGPSGAFNNWVRITSAGFPEGPAMRTPYSVYLGFGFEAIDTAANRNAVMDRVMSYLGQ
jgi:hypothetical protein